MRLYIDLGTHTFTDSDSRAATVQEQLQEPDVVFLEGSDQKPTVTEFVKAWVTAPLVMATFFVYLFAFLAPLQLFFGDDGSVRDEIVENHEAEKVLVDAPKLPFIINNWKLWGVSNWLLIVSSIVYIPGLAATSIMIGIQSVALFVAFIAGIHSARNNHMANQIANHAGTYTEAVLVTGTEHHRPVAKLLSRYDSVEVLNPELE